MREIFEHATNPALWLSFGKDSLLLLQFALEAGFIGPCYFFGDELSDFARQVISDHSLTVYSWPSADRYLIPDGEGLTQIDEYVIGKARVPLISSVVAGERCAHGEYRRFTRRFDYKHDITLTGYKKSDVSGVIGMTFPRELDIGVTRIINPLYDLTDEEVIAQLGFTPPDNSPVEYCDKCLATIQSSDWDREAALAGFRQRFGFH